MTEGQGRILLPRAGLARAGNGPRYRQGGARGDAGVELGSSASGLDLTRRCFDADIEELVETECSSRRSSPRVSPSSPARGARHQARDVVGHSVGEFAALAAASSIGVEETIGLVRERGLAMAEAAREHPADGRHHRSRRDVVERICRRIRGVRPRTTTAPASSWSRARVTRSTNCAQAEEAGARRTVKLIAGAFHSPLDARAAERLGRRWTRSARRAAAPFMSTVTAWLESLLHERPAAPSTSRPRRCRSRRPPQRAVPRRRAYVRGGRPGATIPSGLVERIDKGVKAIPVNSLVALKRVEEALGAALRGTGSARFDGKLGARHRGFDWASAAPIAIELAGAGGSGRRRPSLGRRGGRRGRLLEIGGNAALQVDVASPEEAWDTGRGRRSMFDVLVGNAGPTCERLIARMSDEDWRVVL